MTLFDAIALFSGLAVFCVLQGLFWAMRNKHREREESLRRRLNVGKEEKEELDIGRAVPGEVQGYLARFEAMQRLGTLLLQGGVDLPVQSFVALAAAIIGGIFVLVMLIVGSVASGFVLALVSALLLFMVISSKRDRRLAAIDNQLPKALELMMIGLRAGHTLEDTIRFAGEELQEPLSHELSRCYDEYSLGRPIEEALTNLSVRLAPCKSLRTFVESVLVLKQTGGNLIEIIEQIIDSLRAQAAYEARYRALTSEGRTSGIILGALPLLVLSMVLLLQPGYIGALFTTDDGRIVILIAAGLWVTGVLWLFRLVKPQV